jgi:5-(carboxyamino)imidazole ribonucleotide synthase
MENLQGVTLGKPQSQLPILPGATIGVLGGGQLGRMFALAARALGYRIHIFTTESDAPAAQVADKEIVGAFDDRELIKEFAREVSVVTFEFENIPAATAAAAAQFVPVRPAGELLHITQNRLREKQFLARNHFPVTAFRRVASLADAERAADEIGVPAVLKTAAFGYDGKGQQKITAKEQLTKVWPGFGEQECIFEKLVPFEKELSVIGARTPSGAIEVYPVFENEHANHILDVTRCPARIAPEVARNAQDLGKAVLETLKVEGLLTVEMFYLADGRILINELAPRPHNSGHLTIDAAVTSQFEQQLRAIANLPLGSPGLRQPAAMANLLGELWANGEPNWANALSDPAVKLHLYGKAAARTGRKMGHLTAAGVTLEDATDRVLAARERLRGITFLP